MRPGHAMIEMGRTKLTNSQSAGVWIPLQYANIVRGFCGGVWRVVGVKSVARVAAATSLDTYHPGPLLGATICQAGVSTTCCTSPLRAPRPAQMLPRTERLASQMRGLACGGGLRDGRRRRRGRRTHARPTHPTPGTRVRGALRLLSPRPSCAIGRATEMTSLFGV